MEKKESKVNEVKEKCLTVFNAASLPKEFIIGKVKDSSLDVHIVTHFFPDSPISEQYRRLRENIKALNKQSKIKAKVIAITSSVNSEGKTITSLNLAAALTKDVDCENVVLVDCDLRRGNIENTLGIKSNIGLSDYLMKNEDLEHVLVKTKINKLTIIPRGKSVDNPAELLASGRMKVLLGNLKEKFEFVILDTPPVIPVADSGIICAMADSVVMVIRAGKTQRGIVKHAQELLEQSNANLSGFVLTHVEHYIPQYLYRYV